MSAYGCARCPPKELSPHRGHAAPVSNGHVQRAAAQRVARRFVYEGHGDVAAVAPTAAAADAVARLVGVNCGGAAAAAAVRGGTQLAAAADDA